MTSEMQNPKSKIRILCVENEIVIAELIEKYLKKFGYILAGIVSTGEEAINKFEEWKPDIVLMDIMLDSKMDGIETAEKIKLCSDVPIIYLTGYSDEKRLERAKTTEPFGYIIKPFKARELHASISMAHYKHKTEKELKRLNREFLDNSEKQYQQLFTKMLNGFALHEIVVNEDNKPIDYTFLNANEAFETMTGLKHSEIIGKKVTEVLPGIENDPADWIGVYGKVALTGEEARFEQYSELLGKWYSVYAFRPEENQFAVIIDDITERKQAEETIHQKTRLLRLLQDIAVTANYALTVEEAIHICLDKVCDCTGWPIGHAYMVNSMGKLNPSGIWHLENMKRFDTFRKATEMTSFNRGIGLPGRVLASGKPAWIEDVTKDQNFPRAKLAKKLNVKAGFAFPVLEGKEVIGVLEFFSEEAKEPDSSILETLSNLAVQLGRVTERKRAEELLKENNKKINDQLIELTHVYNNTPVSLSYMDTDMRCKRINKILADIDGISIEDHIGKTLEEVLPKLAHTLKPKIQKVMESEKNLTFEVQGASPTNPEEERHWMVSYHPVKSPDGTVMGVGSVCLDITERKQSEEKLRISEEKVSLLLNSTGEAIYGLDLNGNCTFVNPACMNMLGYKDKNQLINKNMHELAHHTRKDGTPYPEEECKIHMSFKKGTGIRVDDEVLWRSDGTSFPVEYQSFPIFEGKKITGSVVTFVNISDRLKAEESIKTSLQEKEVLLREIHHRVKNNMHVIISLLGLQSRLLKNENDIKIFKQGQERIRSMALIHEKLYESKDLSKINAKDYIESLVRELSISYNIHKNNIDVFLNIAAISINMDTAIPLGLVLNELLSNAFNHAFPVKKKGCVEIFIRTTKKNEIELIVGDDGVCLPESYEIDNPTSLGLKLINGLVVNQLKGKIEVNRNEGTEFKIKFKEIKKD